jgi:tetratricopeptide (TPR) repeat protein
LPYKVLAVSFESLGKRAEAIQAWQELGKVAQGDEDLPVHLGSLLIAEKRPREALPYLENAVTLSSLKAIPLVNLGRAYLQAEEDEKAVQTLDRALRLEPKSSLFNDAALTLADAGKRLQDALRYAQEAVRQEENTSREVDLQDLTADDLRVTRNLIAYWDTLGWIHSRLGNLKEAEGYLRAAWTVGQDSVTGYHLGQVYEKQKRTAEAVRMYRIVADRTPVSAVTSPVAAEAKASLNSLKVSLTPGKAAPLAGSYAADELSRERTVSMPKLAKGPVTAEFFVLLAPGTKVEDTRFVGGSPELRSAGSALAQAHFATSFPEKSEGRIVRRGILGCYPYTGCNFILLLPELVTSVE